MKILQVNKFFYKRGGAEMHMFSLTNILKSHNQEVAFFSTLNNKNEPTEFSKYFIPYIEMRDQKNYWNKFKTFCHLLYSTNAAKKIDELIKDFQPDVAHLHNIYGHLSPSILPILKKHNIPIIMTLHDYKLITPNYTFFDRGQICECTKTKKYYNCLFHKCVFNEFIPSLGATIEMYFHKFLKIYEKNIDLFIAPSEFMKNKMVEYGQDENKIIVLPNFTELPNELPNTTLGDYLLYVGRLAEEKGLLVLLEAAKLMPEVKIRIVGAGPLEPRMQQKIKKENIKNITLVGYKTGNELKNEILNSRACVLPSIWYENYPLSILETSSYGKMTLASHVGGIPEIIKDGKNGLLFNINDPTDLAKKVQKVWQDEEKIKQMGLAAYKHVKEINNPEKYYQTIIKIYQGLIDKKAKKS